MSLPDFFGKKLGGWVYKAAAHLSPVDLRAGELGRRIGSSFETGGMMDAGREIFGGVRNAIRDRGSYSVGDWLSGRNIGEAESAITSSIRNARMTARIAPLAAMGVAGASGMLAPDNPLDRMARTGLGLGAHAAIAGTLGSRIGWGAGAAYSGLAALNVLRPGNNMGPF